MSLDQDGRPPRPRRPWRLKVAAIVTAGCVITAVLQTRYVNIMTSLAHTFGRNVDRLLVGPIGLPVAIGFLPAGIALFWLDSRIGDQVRKEQLITVPGQPVPGRPGPPPRIPVIDPRTGQPQMRRSVSPIRVWAIVITSIGVLELLVSVMMVAMSFT